MTSPPSSPSTRRPHRDTAQNFYKCQNNFAQGITLDQYLYNSSAFNTSSTNLNKTRRNKFEDPCRPSNCLSVRITERTESSSDNSEEKRYLDASFEINETDEDGYLSNSSAEAREKEARWKNKSSKRKAKDKSRAFGPNNSLLNHQNFNREQVNGRDQQCMSKEGRENSYFHQNITRETFYSKEARENSYNSKDNRENTFYGHTINKETMGKGDTKMGKTKKRKEIMNNVCVNENEQKENIQKTSNQSNRTHHSQSPVQNTSEMDFSVRRNCSKDANESLRRKEKNDMMRSTFRNSKNNNNNNNNNELLNTNYSIFIKKGNETGSKFNQSNYLQKSKGTMSEFYKNQGKYSDNLPIGPPKR